MDFLSDENHEILIENGDFAIGDNEAQDIQRIVQAQRGEFRQFPALGVGMKNWLNGPLDKRKLKKDVALHLQSDGFQGVKVTIGDDYQINIEATRP